MSRSEQNIESLAEQWLRLDRDPETRATIQGLLTAHNTPELEKRLRSRLAFGTAGLRAPMDAGYAHMNALTILQTAIGLGEYMLENAAPSTLVAKKGAESSSSSDKVPSVVIGFDGRRNSARFAHLSATVFLDMGFHVLLFPDIVPTPFVPFAVRKYNLTAGVMVTASHNPPNDNGYKVYWSTGAQIVSPQDVGIAESIERCLGEKPPQPKHWDTFGVESKCENPTAPVHEEFFQSMEGVMLSGKCNSDSEEVAGTPLVYTAMHGVGTAFTLQAMRKVAGMRATHPVPEQCFPDPYFRTVDFPNPEEGKSALNLAIRTADATATRADIIVANDPDADRLAAAERRPDGSGWQIFNGNELGALFGWWLVEVAKKKGTDLGRCAVLCSTVSSMILRSIAEHPDNKGLYFEETLTGFKFMGTKAKELAERAENPRQTIFAFEEAIGFMCGDRVRDKDGVTAAAVLCDMIRHCRAGDKGWTLRKQLDAVFAKYGVHLTNTSYVLSKDPKQTMAMFDALRGDYPKKVGGVDVVSVLDLCPPGFDSTRADKKPVLPLSSASSPMLTIQLANGVRFTVRASGTEPKIKYYTEIILKPNSGGSREHAAEELQRTIAAILKELIQPEKYGFVMRSE